MVFCSQLFVHFSHRFWNHQRHIRVSAHLAKLNLIWWSDFRMSGHLWHINRVWFGVFFSFWCLCFCTFCIKKFSFYLILEFLNLHFSRFDFMFILCLFVFDFGNWLKKFISFSLNFSKIFLLLLLHVCDFVFQIICFFFRLFKFGLQPWNLSS